MRRPEPTSRLSQLVLVAFGCGVLLAVYALSGSGSSEAALPPVALRASSFSTSGNESPEQSFYRRLQRNSDLMSTVPFDAAGRTGTDSGLSFVQNTYSVLGHELVIWDTKHSITSRMVAQELNEGEYHLTSIRERGMLPPNCTILDLGTNVGITAIVVAKVFPSCRVIGVEPAPPNYACALANIAANGVADRVTVLPAALAPSTAAPIGITYSVINPGSSTGSDEFFKRGSSDLAGHRNYEVWPITVDEILEHFNVQSASFIKLDCEGCEYFILPAMSGHAKQLFSDALLMGETHADRMTLDPEVVDYVHDLYDGYVQSGPGHKVKRWSGA